MVELNEIAHESHPGHKLRFESKKGAPYECDGCKQLGFDTRYACQPCNFHLHVECADPLPSLSHPFFKTCSFKFMRSGMPRRVCDACGMAAKGFIYHCDCDVDLHPCCANLEPVLEDGGLKLVLQQKMSSKCSKCHFCRMEKVLGVSRWCYVSTCKTYAFHIACVKQQIKKNWRMLESYGDGEGPSGGPGEGEGDMLESYGDGVGPSGGPGEGEGDGRALAKRTPMLQLDVVGGNKSTTRGKFAMLKKTLKIAITLVIAAILGDPTALVASLIANLIAH